MTVRPSPADLIARARAHADTHSESRGLIADLLDLVDSLTRTIRRVVSGTWADDLDGDTGAESMLDREWPPKEMR